MLTLTSDVQSRFLQGQMRDWRKKTRPQGANFTGEISYSIIPLIADELIEDGLVTTNAFGLCILPKGARVLPSKSEFEGEAIGMTMDIGTAAVADAYATAAAVGSAITGGTDLALPTYPTELTEQTEIIGTVTIPTTLTAGNQANLILAWLMP